MYVLLTSKYVLFRRPTSLRRAKVFLKPRAVAVQRMLILLGTATCVFAVAEQTTTAQQTPRGFSETALEVGLIFDHTSGVQGKYRFPEIMGSGAAVFDYDSDGLLDVYLVNGGDPDAESNDVTNHMFRQLPNGKFVDRTGDSGLGDKGYGMGVAIGDVDNDGDIDVYITNLRRDRIYRNLGNGTFEDVTEESGIDVQDWSTSATFCDVNSDGLLDLYVGTYVQDDSTRKCRTGTGEPDYCAPNVFSALPDRLFLNRGSFKFEEQYLDEKDAVRKNRALGVVCADFNNDSRSDLYVANDGERNFLWINEGNDRFTERGIAMGVAVNAFGETEASMGVDIADLNGDLRMDIFVTHLDRETDTMYLSNEELYFDSTAEVGLALPTFKDTAFGTAFADFNHDGRLDLLIVNGNVRKSSSTSEIGQVKADSPLTNFHRDYTGKNRLFLGDRDGKFQPVDNDFYNIEDSTRVSRSLITADIDADGDLDALVTNSNSSVQLFRNDIDKLGNWVKFRVLDEKFNRDAIGSVVELDIGKEALLRPVLHTRGYLSSQDAAVHFGLEDGAEIHEVRVHWSDGSIEVFDPPEPNTTHTLMKSRGNSTN